MLKKHLRFRHWWNLLLWQIVKVGYKPPWINGNKYQQWWYFKIDILIESLTNETLNAISEAEKELELYRGVAESGRTHLS